MKTWIGWLALPVVFALVGCGGGGSGDPSGTGGVGTGTGGGGGSSGTGGLQIAQTGEFIDARVAGLGYWTASHGFGTTDENGGFQFLPGEMVVFYIGNQMLLYTDAEPITTPMDTLAAEVATAAGGRHPHEAINILRLLQSVDETPSVEGRISLPSYFADATTSLGLDLAQESHKFAEQALAQVPPNFIPEVVSFEVAAAHFRESLENLDDNLIDLTGTWVDVSGRGEEFGVIGEARSELVWEIELDRVAVSGTELHTREDGDGNIYVFTTPFPIVEADVGDVVDQLFDDFGPAWSKDAIAEFVNELVDEFKSEGFEIDDRGFLTWNISEFGLFDEGMCESARCSLAELRSIAYVDVDCGGSNCVVSDPDNDVFGYSEVTWAQRLGGDRLIRMKRDFWRDELDQEFAEDGYFFSILDRKEAHETVVDLTGEWELTHIGSDPKNKTTETITFGDSDVSHPSLVPFTCKGGFKTCGWSELNQRQDGASLIHVRGTAAVNWATDSGFYTMRRPH